ncbi:MAG: hypothetical protein Q4D14_07945 [Bacteroidales bacterium]|nr:hypothetical protein [Bacteroidales bacterium]
MKKNITSIAVILILCLVGVTAQAKIWYVSQGGRGAKDGTSWTNAASDIMDLIPAYTRVDTVDSNLKFMPLIN